MSEQTDQAFDADVDQWILQAVAAGTASFDELLVALPGVYPTVVCAGLDRLARHSALADDVHTRLRRRSRRNLPVVQYRQRQHTIPAPHPLDYDWRFTPEAVALLLRESRRLSSGNDPLVLLGVPSVFQALRADPAQPAVLLDASPATIAALQPETTTSPAHHRALRCDLNHDPIPAINARAVLLDPPWYEPHVRLFLWAAARLCRLGGHILISFPPVGTRPGIVQEQQAMLDWAAQLGLEPANWAAGVLGYTSPPFERNALAAACLGDLPDGWRRGDLVTLRRTRPSAPPRPTIRDVEQWNEVAIDGVRIRFRGNQSRCWGDPMLRSLVDGDVLDSVSRRWTRRREVQVWTSANRVFACQATGILQELVDALAANHNPYRRVEQRLSRPLTVSERDQTAAAITQITKLLVAERHDLARWGWTLPASTKEKGSAESAA